MAKSLKELKREITCAICLDHYTEPKVLPCSHYHCKQCILKLALTGTDKPFSCPECRKEVTLPEANVDKLPTAFVVNRFKTVFAVLERAHGKVEVKCEVCQDSADKAEAFCRQCAMFICQACVTSHQRMKTIFNGHEVVSLQDLKHGRAREIAVKEPPAKKCAVHEEPLIVYCFDCDALICRDCTVKDHRDHNFEFSKVAASNSRKQLMEKLEELREVEASLSRAVEAIHTTKCELEAQRDYVANSIDTSFKELLEILEDRKRELLGSVGKKMDKLSLQERDLSLAGAEVQRVGDYAEQSVKHCDGNEVVSMHAEITSRVEQEIEEHKKREKSLEPVEGVDVGVEVRCAEALKQLCQTKAKITQLPIDPAKCAVIVEGTITVVEGAITAEVNKTADLTLITRLSNNEPTQHICIVDCHLKFLSSGYMVKCNTDRTGPRNYSIQCTPTVRGRHELTVSADGQQVAGSPFPVFVTISPTQLGKPVRVWAGLSNPCGVTVNSVGEIIVAGLLRDVITFDREGNELRSVKHNGSLSGVAVDGEDNIYCPDWYSNKIFTCNKNGGNVQVHEVKQVKGQGHRGVAVVGDEVMLCGCHSKGTIMVYDRELKYVRKIVGEGMGTFSDLSPDSHGNLYVTDYNNSCIRVFSKDGVFLRSFGSAGNGVEKLSGPCGVCVAGQYVYVTDSGNYNVSVFTTEGEYVTSFGQRGRNEGDFINPHGVCVDEDGFVYVTDCNNKRVQIF